MLVDGALPPTASIPDESVLHAEVFYQYSHPTPTPIISSTVSPAKLEATLNAINTGTTGNSFDTFVRSQYTRAYGLDIQKIYSNKSNLMLHPDDLIEARIIIKNITNQPIKNIEYLDTIPRIFSSEKTQKYYVTINGKTITRDFEAVGDNEFDAYFF